MGEGKRSGRARASAVATAVAITAPILFLGAAVARGAESSSVTPTRVSVTYTDADGQPPGSGNSTTGDTGNTASTTTQDLAAPINGADGNTGTTANTDYGSNAVQQVIAVSMQPGPLTITPSSESVSFTKPHGHGNGGLLAGSVSTVTVVDARGSLAGWNATVSLESVDGVSTADLAKAKLCVTPAAPTVVAGNLPEVKAGHHACGKAGDPLTLFYAPPQGGGGTFSDTGSLTLLLPGGAPASSLTATVALAVH